jgi:hypothetical protein
MLIRPSREPPPRPRLFGPQLKLRSFEDRLSPNANIVDSFGSTKRALSCLTPSHIACTYGVAAVHTCNECKPVYNIYIGKSCMNVAVKACAKKKDAKSDMK